ncbi:recombinase family protein [Shewanella atlantica]|uniref:Recombinase family protein n=1 Tax=Shewanella atlantica TaxID=271099 RepID=A0A431W2P3_9GAMM|nr:recombinase family protein [Shewanella atlantica]RTR29702.1 recombinase family protein [Shewanella atlantica]
MATYLYTRFSPKNKAYPEQLAAMTSLAPGAEHFQDKVRGDVPPMERTAFSQLFKSLGSGDTVLIWWLTEFGHDFSQTLQVITDLLEKGVILQTLCEPLVFEPDSPHRHALLALLSGYGKVQTQRRLFAAEQGRKALKDKPEQWKQKFCGRPADKEKHQQIATLLLEGQTLQSVAEQCDVSLSTVKRVKAKLNTFDDEGSLRRRAKTHSPSGDA